MTVSISEFKRDVLEQKVSLPVLLRRAISIAKTTKDEENEKWMTAELNGYEETGEPPEYRILGGQPKFFNRFVGWEMLHYQIADERIVKHLTSMPITCPIIQVEKYAQEEEVLLQYGDAFESYINSTVNKLGKPALSLSGIQFERILEVVRNKLFEWASHLPDESETMDLKGSKQPMTETKGLRQTVENHPLGFAVIVALGTVIIVAGLMTWIQKNREDNLMTRYETEKVGLKNDYESQIRELKLQIRELQNKGTASKQPSK